MTTTTIHTADDIADLLLTGSSFGGPSPAAGKQARQSWF